MRWKLLGLVSVIGALFGVALWSAVTIAVFGSASVLARDYRVLLGSLVVPLTVTVFGALFVYRHTAHRRKTQAAIATLITLLLAAIFYLAAARLITSRLSIPKTSDAQRSR
jgi:uncharacterized membrane protein